MQTHSVRWENGHLAGSIASITSDLQAARDGAMTFSFMFNYTFKLDNMGFFHSTKDSESPNQGLNLKHEVRSTQLFCHTAHWRRRELRADSR